MRATFVLSEVFQNLRRNLFMVVSVILVTFISLVFVGASALLQSQIGKAKGDWYDKVQVAVYLCPDYQITQSCPTGDGATDVDVKKLEDIIHAELGDEVKSIDVHTKTQAFDDFKKKYPDGVYNGQTLTEDDMQISMRLGLYNPEHFSVVADVLTNRTGVMTVSDERKLFQSIFDVMNQLTVVSLALAVLMIVSALLLIATTIRLSAASRWKETEIMRLVGASNWFIQLPFVLEGVIAAVLGAVLAGGFIELIIGVFIDNWVAESNKWMEFVTTSEALVVFPLLIGIAVVIATLSSVVTLRKYLKV